MLLVVGSRRRIKFARGATRYSPKMLERARAFQTHSAKFGALRYQILVQPTKRLNF
jgi:hypothetical protein